VLAALEECARRGIPVVVVTARRWAGAATLLAELPGPGIAVVAGGTEIRVIATGRELIGRRLPAAIVGAACARIAACGLQPMVAEGPRSFRAADPRRDGVAASRYLARAGVRRVPVAHLAAGDATRVLAMGSRSRCNLAAQRCADLPARIVMQDCIVDLDEHGERPTELHVAAADKGDALRALCHHLGVAPGDTLAIGDAPSDLPMLAAAGVGVLMGQAAEGLRRPSFVMAPSVDDDGAAWALQHLVLRDYGGASEDSGLQSIQLP
jgi:HAD superfamily hydrolase (TIGR01484 family)